MRISDWSSDVCSSDLRPAERGEGGGTLCPSAAAAGAEAGCRGRRRGALLDPHRPPMTARAVAYRPPGPVARAFMTSDAFVRGIRGPYGSGKSVACCMEIFRRANGPRPGQDGVRASRWAGPRTPPPDLQTPTHTTWPD